MTLTSTAFTYYKYLHPLRHSLLFYFVLLVQAQIFSFERRTEVYLLCWLAVWEAPDVAIEFKPPSASDGFKAVICEPCVHECVCAADAHWVGVAFVWWGQRFHCMWYTGGAAELVQTQMLMFNIILSVIKYVYTVGQLNVIVFFYLYLTVSALLYLKLVLSLMLWIKSHTILKHSSVVFFN